MGSDPTRPQTRSSRFVAAPSPARIPDTGNLHRSWPDAVDPTPRVQSASRIRPSPSMTATPVSLATTSAVPSRQARSTPRKRAPVTRKLYRTAYVAQRGTAASACVDSLWCLAVSTSCGDLACSV
jgi:hypothetical protein